MKFETKSALRIPETTDMWDVMAHFVNFIFTWEVKEEDCITLSQAESCFDSMEQLWLAFVMKTNYNKLWDGQGWREAAWREAAGKLGQVGGCER